MWRLFRRRKKEKAAQEDTLLLEQKASDVQPENPEPQNSQPAEEAAVSETETTESGSHEDSDSVQDNSSIRTVEVDPEELIRMKGGKPSIEDTEDEQTEGGETLSKSRNKKKNKAVTPESAVRPNAGNEAMTVKTVSAEKAETGEKPAPEAQTVPQENASPAADAAEEDAPEVPERSLYEWTLGKKKKGQKKAAEKKTVLMGNVKIGKGTPKICVPVTGTTPEEIIAQTEEAVKAEPDLIEWRADYFGQIRDKGVADTVIEKMALITGEIPILFTYRNKREGGSVDLFPDEYQSIVRWAAGRKEVSAVDIEGLHPEVDTEILTAEVHQAGKMVIASAHYFVRMPKKQEMEWTIDRLEKTGADILKLAVMPVKPKDVLKLMEVTEEKNREISCPIITMAMGEMGKISRVSGSLTGSAVTFGTAGSSSAPGQMPVEELRAVMKALA